jgi:hypothetical protein
MVLLTALHPFALSQPTNASNQLVQAQQATPVQPTRPRRIRVSGAVMLAMFERKTMPVYPDEALLKGIRGEVILNIEVDDTGKVVLCSPVEGDPLLVAASVEALKDSRFRPYLLNGTPIWVETQLGFHFSVEKMGGSITGKVECITSIPDRAEFRTGVETDAGVIVLDPHKISGGDPKLPPELEGKSGSVYLAITVGADGKVQDVKVISGDQPFVGPVVDAVKRGVYEPRLVDGKPSAAMIEDSYHFGPRR